MTDDKLDDLILDCENLRDGHEPGSEDYNFYSQLVQTLSGQDKKIKKLEYGLQNLSLFLTSIQNHLPGKEQDNVVYHQLIIKQLISASHDA